MINISLLDNVKKFLCSLDKPAIYKTLRIIDLLDNYGYQLEMPHCKKLFGKFFELRVRGRTEIRFVYFFHKGKIIIFHGFVKKTGKIPKKEIETILSKIKGIDLS